jgi:hypothetical protein
MKFLRNVFLVICMFGLLGANGGCEPQSPQTSSSGAGQVTSFFKVPLNSRGNTAEQQNVLDRLVVTTDPTKVLWIHLIALDGKIVKRMPLSSKVTSSGKRLEPRHASTVGQYGSLPSAGNDFRTDEFIQPDGTYGESDPYIYWFDPMGRYHQWGTAGGLGYLLTDYPIDLQDPMDDAITGLYKVSKEALEWQKLQEQELRAREQKHASQSVKKPVEEVIPSSPTTKE